MNQTPNRVLALVLTIAALMTGQRAWAESSWEVTNNYGNSNTFTITRSEKGYAQKVLYRTISLSAYAGQHFTAKNGELEFLADEDEKTVTVSELTPSSAYLYYKDGTTVKYGFEVTDRAGFRLAYAERKKTWGTSVPASGAFSIKDITIEASEYLNTDDGYDNNVVKSVNSSSYFSSTNTAPKAYYQLVGAELRMTLSMDVKEDNDGYQYMSILNSTTLYDNRKDCSNGDPGNISNSWYMAGFEHKTGGKDGNYKSYSFPVTSVGNNTGHSNPWGHGTDYILSMQKFNTNRRASDGRLLLPMDFSIIAVRCNASGNDEDDWYAKNVKAHIQAVDGTAPTKSAVSVNPGRHAKGNTVYVSVAFSEIVTVTGTPTLSTTADNHWGSLTYVEGSGTNVLTFSTTIPQDATGSLNITGLSGTVKDLAGNSLTGSGVIASGLCTLDGDLTYTIEDFQAGSKANEYLIACHDDLWGLASYVNGGNDASGLTFRQVTNLTFPHTTNWNSSSSTENNFTRIGDDGHPFRGTFDGGGHTISGIRIYKDGITWADAYQGLFGKVGDGGTVKRVTLADARITGRNYIGGIAGDTYLATIEDCTVDANVCIHTVQSNTSYYGGIVGLNQSGTVRRCISRATLTVANGKSGCKDFGGIVGFKNGGTITDCIADGVVIPDVNGRGAITGYQKNGGTLTRNYYRGCTVAGTANATGVGKGNSEVTTETSDVDGALPLYLITLGTNVTINRTPATDPLPGTNNYTYTNGADIAGVPYGYEGATVALGYSGEVGTGYHVEFTATAGTINGSTLTMRAEAVSVSATVPANSYTVRFYKNDGGEDYTDQAFTYDESQDLTTNAFTRVGYTFSGWNTQADGKGTSYTNQQEVSNLTATQNGVFELFAQWTVNQYTVTLDNQNATSAGTAEVTATYDATMPAITLPTRTGYTFGGYYTETNGGGTKYYNADGTSANNWNIASETTLYAKWTAITYTLTYELAGGSVASANPENYTIESGDITLVNPTRTGYTFAGWTGTGLAEATQTVTISTGSYGDKSYTATWTPITYSVRFNKNHNDATGTMDDQAFTYDEAQDLTTNAFTRIGYTFTGWNTKSNGSGNAYTDEQEVSNLTATQGDVINLYAQWHFLDGNGSQATPYLIHNSGELLKLAARTANGTQFTNEYFQLEADIDMDGITWDGIGEFHGIFDGAGHTISNVTINRPDDKDVGLFNDLLNGSGKNCAVKNLILDGATITGKNSVGAIVGDLTFTPAIENCVVLNANVTLTNPAGTQGGIIAGINNSTGTNNYYYNCSLTIGGETRTSNIGAASSDRDNAKGIYRLTLGSEITQTAPSRTSGTPLSNDITLYADGATIDGKEYYAAGTSITVELSGSYTGVSVNSNSIAATDNGDGTYTFTMPAEDATVGGVASGYCGMASVNSGQNVIWTYDGSTTTLTISPNPAVSEQTDFRMTGYGESDQPWNDYKGAITTVVIEAGVTSIGHSAFENCSSLTAITLPDGLTSIGGYAFYGCNSLTAITLPASVTSIGYNAFRNCSKLESINIPDGITTIPNGVFQSCSSLESITLPASVTSIGNYAFYYCSKLESITLPASVTSIGRDAFDECDKLTSIIVLPVTPPTITDNNLGDFGFKASGKNVYFRNPAYMDNDGWSAVVNTKSYELGYALVDNGENDIAALATYLNGNSTNMMLYGRTLYRDGDWNTLCLPFDIKLALDMDNIRNNEDHIFHGATVMRFNTSQWFDSEGYTYSESADGRHRSGEVDASGNLYLYFSKMMNVNDFYSSAISAGTPCIVKWGTKDSHPATDIVNPVFQGVTVTSTTPIDRITEEGQDLDALDAYWADTEHNPYPYGNVTMRGTYSPIDYASDNHSILFVGMNNSLYWPQAGAHLGAFRAYFELGNGITVGEANSSVRGFNLEFSEDNGDATRLNDNVKMINDKEADAWYTLDGRKLDSKPTRKGLYIYGGRKVVIK